ncbi:nitrate reductase [Mangrovicoccus algicola]|uniref:Molybdopterin-dependent oxidoreductase n=1 Tax=Mangrovicoccus algicola TaxID=2771008 RepID=A0A8J6YZH4_9RHOB|nr:nitrate reductase [Mangrovicoccus algicola]MBE3639559.1 molybdopterin-dependent oxidoreductase [Mangrovicoccus algicola]
MEAASSPAEIRTTCPYCGVGCGVLARPDPQGGLRVRGDPDHPANRGRLCSKGSALGETLALEGRGLHPLIGGTRAGWDEATALIAEKFRDTIAEHGPDAVAFYVSGQLLTEDYYVANKLMKGFIGSGNIDTNSRLCMASSVAGHRRAFGTDTVPGQYEDLEEADLIVLTGSNLAWCHPVLYQRILAAKSARPELKIVNIDPRRTASSDMAELHLALEPGSDVALFNGLLARIARRGAADAAWLAAHVSGYEAALAAAGADDDAATGLSRDELDAFYDLWIGTEKVVTVYSQGVNQSSAGADKVNAILNCHLATGRIGRPGMGPFSVTGQPNAMGGREVGGLANMLACHLDLEDPAHRLAVRDFWDAPRMAEAPGLKAVDMFRAVGDGRIKAIWIMCTNPAVSMPEADAVAAAIAACPFVVVSDMYADTDTAKLADVFLPATGWGEKTGTVTNSERCISRQRATLPVPGEARHDWQALAGVAAAMGWGAEFDYASPAEIFREHAALSEVAGRLGRDFDISGLKDISDPGYDALAPQAWPVTAARQGGRFFGAGGFFTPDGRARMLPLSARAPARPVTASHPLRLNTGRVRDHWHTMTRSGLSPRLSQHIAEPFLEMHPRDAAARGLSAAELVRVTSPAGEALLRLVVTDRLRPGTVFAPMHWTGQAASAGRIDAVVAAETDPVSGQPESKATPVEVAALAPAWYGFAVTLAEPRADTAYWAKARAGAGWRMELAEMAPPRDWEALARQVAGLPDATAVTVSDAARGLARVALMQDGRVAAALFAGPEPVAVARSHVIGLLGGTSPGPVLAARPGEDQPDQGAIVCACFSVGVNTIISAIETGNLADVDAIGAACRAGTNCGSCKAELRTILTSIRHQEAAQ